MASKWQIDWDHNLSVLKVSSMSMWMGTQPIQMCALRSWVSGDSKGRMSLYWICTRCTCRSTSSNLCGHSKQWELRGKILPHPRGIWAERGTSNHVIHCQSQMKSSTALLLHILTVYSPIRVYVLQPMWRHILGDLDWPAKTLNNWGMELVC